MTPLTLILLIAIPTLLTLGATWYTLRTVTRTYLLTERRRITVEERRITLPMQLQACERIALLLERISPEALLLRVPINGVSSAEYEVLLLENIREEWNHNVSQQIYITAHTWELVKQAKGKLVQLISQCAAQVHKEAPAIELSRAILVAIPSEEEHPTLRALRAIQNEASLHFA